MGAPVGQSWQDDGPTNLSYSDSAKIEAQNTACLCWGREDLPAPAKGGTGRRTLGWWVEGPRQQTLWVTSRAQLSHVVGGGALEEVVLEPGQGGGLTTLRAGTGPTARHRPEGRVQAE